MSKRDLKKYLTSLPKEELEEQMLSLYEKFADVKAYYNFIFNPKEDKLEQEAKLKISNEYFPLKGKRPKLRRSMAQKYIKNFLTLGVDPFVVADVMLYNIEIAQKYSVKRTIRYDSFYKSMLNSYKQVVDYVVANGVAGEFKKRILDIHDEAHRQRWDNQKEFERIYDNFE
jgi:C4-dicarboxylate transporter